MLRLLKNYLIWRWGVRGGLKPPLAPYGPAWADPRPRNAFLVAWYFWRYWCWCVEDAAYRACKIPELWEELRRKTGVER